MKGFGWAEECIGNVIMGWVGFETAPIDEVILECIANGELYNLADLAECNRSDLLRYPWRKTFFVAFNGIDAMDLLASGSINLSMNCGNDRTHIGILPALIGRAVWRRLGPTNVTQFAGKTNISHPQTYSDTNIDDSPGDTDSQSITDVDLLLQLMEPAPKPKPLLATGTITDHGDAALGAGGTLFLAGGSNNIQELYKSGSNGIMFDEWCALIKKRDKFTDTLGARFIQLLVPEKSSALHWKSPFDAHRGAIEYNNIVSKLHAELGHDSVIVDLLSIIQDDVDIEPAYRTYDTHLSTYGARAIVDHCVALLGHERCYASTATVYGKDPGDLGTKFDADGSLYEKPVLYEGLKNKSGRVLEPTLIDALDPRGGHHIGMMRRWYCAGAPIDKKVLCFGNSFFERGNTSTTLSWWFARPFKSFTFIWSPALLPDVASNQGADIIVCQTNERFLPILPSD